MIKADLYLDHVLIAVKDLSEAGRTFGKKLGFTLTPEGAHPGRGTSNRLIVFGPEYLELISITDPAEFGAEQPELKAFLEAREGLYMFSLGTESIEETVASIRERGGSITDPVYGAREQPGGGEYSWRSASLKPGSTPGSNTFIIQHDSTIEERYRQLPNATQHPNGILGIDHLSIAVRDADEAAAAWQKLFGLEEGPPEEEPPSYIHRASLKLRNCVLHFVSPQGEGPLSQFIQRHEEAPYLLCLKATNSQATENHLLSCGVAVAHNPGSNRPERRHIAPNPHGVQLHFVTAGT